MSPGNRFIDKPEEGSASATVKSGEGSRLGDTLRKAREEKGLTVDDLSRKSRLRPAMIRALEEGHVDQMPAQPYVVGFLKLLARNLGLSEQDLLKLYTAESERHMRGFNFAAPSNTSPNRPGKVTILGGLVIFIALFATYGIQGSDWFANKWQEIKTGKLLKDGVPFAENAVEKGSPAAMLLAAKTTKPASTPVPDPTTKAVETPPAPPTNSQAPPLQSVATASAPATASNTEKPATVEPTKPVVETSKLVVETTKPEPEPTKPVMAADKVKPTSQEPAEEDELAPVSATQPVANTPEAPVVGGKKYQRWEAIGPISENANAHHVTIVAARKAWIQIKDQDGAVVKDMVLKPGQKFHVFESERYTLSVGNAAAITLLVDNQSLSELGAEGHVVKKISLAKDALLKRAKESAKSAKKQPDQEAPATTDEAADR